MNINNFQFAFGGIGVTQNDKNKMKYLCLSLMKNYKKYFALFHVIIHRTYY